MSNTMMEAKIAEAEANRRETCGQFSTAPMAKGTDYGVSLAVLTQAVAHLAEGLPNGQLGRTAAAMDAAAAAVSNLATYFHWVQQREKEHVAARRAVRAQELLDKANKLKEKAHA